MNFTPCGRAKSKVYPFTDMRLKIGIARLLLPAIFLNLIALFTGPASARPQCMCPDDWMIIARDCPSPPYSVVTGAVCSSDNPFCVGSPDYWVCCLTDPIGTCQTRNCINMCACSGWGTKPNCCPNGTCDGAETHDTCPDDCPSGPPPCGVRGDACTGAGQGTCCNLLKCGTDSGSQKCEPCLLGEEGCCNGGGDCTGHPGDSVFCCLPGSHMCGSHDYGPRCYGGESCSSNDQCTTGCCQGGSCASSTACGCTGNGNACTGNGQCCSSNCAGGSLCCPTGQQNCSGSCATNCGCSSPAGTACSQPSDCCNSNCSSGKCCPDGQTWCTDHCQAPPCAVACHARLQDCTVACCSTNCPVPDAGIGGAQVCCNPGEVNCGGCMTPKAGTGPAVTCVHDCECATGNCSGGSHCCNAGDHFSNGAMCCGPGTDYCDLTGTCVVTPAAGTCNCTGTVRCDGSCSTPAQLCTDCKDVCGNMFATEITGLGLKNRPVQLRDALGRVQFTSKTDNTGNFVFNIDTTKYPSGPWYVVPVLSKLETAKPAQSSPLIVPVLSSPTFSVKGVPGVVHVSGRAGAFVLLSTWTYSGAKPPTISHAAGSTSMFVSGVINPNGNLDLSVPSAKYYTRCWIPQIGGGFTGEDGTPLPTGTVNPQSVDTAVSCP
jgi:hypothetical protein